MGEVLESLREQKNRLAPTFAFVDPFGITGVEMVRIRELMSFDRCELLVNLATQSMARWIKSPEFEKHHDALFGTAEWRQGAELPLVDRRRYLVDPYEQQLREQCGFTHTLHFEMINPGGQHSYYLVYATNHRKGVEIMKDAMWAVDPSGGSRFAARFAGQEVLFSGDAVDTGPLRSALLVEFSGQTVSIERLEEFTLFRTPFQLGHLKNRPSFPWKRQASEQCHTHRRAAAAKEHLPGRLSHHVPVGFIGATGISS